jgi:hypothetical protein
MRKAMLRTAFLFKNIGFNGSGFRLSTKRTLFLTFMRPVLEYGIQLLTTKSALDILQKTQNIGLRLMTSAPKGTSTNSLHCTLSIPRIEDRHKALRTRWLNRATTAGTGFLVTWYRLVDVKRCVFDVNVNNLALEGPPELQDICGIVVRFLKQQRKTLVDQEKAKTKEMTDYKKLIQHLDSFEDNRTASRMLLWILRRPFGQPKKCRKCNATRPSCDHFQECAQEKVDSIIKQQRWKEAAEALRNIAARCMGWNQAKNSNWKQPKQ